MTATVDVKFTSSQLPGAGGGTPPYRYRASPLPPGLSFNGSSRKISGKPTTAGAWTVTYTASDSGGSGPLGVRGDQSVSRSFKITVNPAPLTLEKPADLTAAVGVYLESSALPEAEGGTPGYSYNAMGLPSGLSFNNSTRVISGTPINPGTVTVTYTALDSGGEGPLERATQTVSKTFTITSEPLNVGIEGGSSVIEGNAAEFTLTASHAPTDNVTVGVTVTQTGDFGVSTGTYSVTISGGTDSGTLSVGTKDDGMDEEDGSILARLQPGTGYSVGSPSSSSVTVKDDDDLPLPEVSVFAVTSSVEEGGMVHFRFTAGTTDIGPNAPADVTVKIVISETGTMLKASPLTRPTTQDITGGLSGLSLETAQDTIDEQDSVVRVTILEDDAYRIAAGSATATVTDRDDKPPAPTDLRVNGNRDKELTGPVTLRWKAGVRATSFKVEWALENCSDVTIAGVCTYTARLPQDITASGVAVKEGTFDIAGTGTYRLKVVAVNDEGDESGPSEPAFVKPSANPPSMPTETGGPTVASIELDAFQAGGTFNYTICDPSALQPNGISPVPSRFVALGVDVPNSIERMVNVWANSVKWETGGVNIITSAGTASASGCVEPGMNKESLNQIVFADDTLFWKVCKRLDINGCWVYRKGKSQTTAQAPSSMLIRSTPVPAGSWGTVDTVAGCTPLESLLIHETGHAFGVGHTPLALSAMFSPQERMGPVLPFCEPTGYDIAATMFIYQSR